jgi:hypothetical protein
MIAPLSEASTGVAVNHAAAIGASGPTYLQHACADARSAVLHKLGELRDGMQNFGMEQLQDSNHNRDFLPNIITGTLGAAAQIGIHEATEKLLARMPQPQLAALALLSPESVDPLALGIRAQLTVAMETSLRRALDHHSQSLLAALQALTPVEAETVSGPLQVTALAEVRRLLGERIRDMAIDLIDETAQSLGAAAEQALQAGLQPHGGQGPLPMQTLSSGSQEYLLRA